ncbi:hypothetical protein FYJ24_03000 [Actinomycetaceae bacterium WB03_NA08]|uniref:Uncharacterized protein n=1 Tax=Scrofimicrobium canadense TaxID=2652290 RepID=A0A6N7W5F8_9ACTO|nr:hypothetical protein [Scrofimicrobium canadense]MSS83743.1 hypothetical protein [Scrofimicrobium canadense]
MTSKLLKYEYLRTRDGILIIWAIALGIATVGCLMILMKIPALSSLGLAFAVMVTVLLIPATQLYLGIDYWASSYRREGYLTQTLPIPGPRIYWAKLAWAVIATVVSAIIAVLLALAIVASAGELGTLANWWDQVLEITPAWAFIVVGIVAVTYLFNLVISLFFAATLGSIEPLNRWGIGGPVVIMVASYFVTQMTLLLTILLIPVGIGLGPSGMELHTFSFASLFTSNTVEFMPVGWIPAVVILSLIQIFWAARLWRKGASLN